MRYLGHFSHPPGTTQPSLDEIVAFASHDQAATRLLSRGLEGDRNLTLSLWAVDPELSVHEARERLAAQGSAGPDYLLSLGPRLTVRSEPYSARNEHHRASA